MNRKSIFYIGLLLIITIISISCEKEESEENEVKISQYNKDDSHNTGQNCMNCHTSGGSGEGWFRVAGSIYNSSKENSYPNATIKIYSEPNETGTLVKTIEVDGNGNFYTTENIDFGSGLFITVTTPDGNIKSMNSAISNGECNSCHGNSTVNIWIE